MVKKSGFLGKIEGKKKKEKEKKTPSAKRMFETLTYFASIVTVIPL